MATIIETKHGFIAGDPPEVLPEGHHWCDSCGGDGLEYQEDHEGEQYLTTCWSCSGCCTMPCEQDDCAEHPKPIPSQEPTVAEFEYCGRGICAAEVGHEGTCAEASGWADHDLRMVRRFPDTCTEGVTRKGEFEPCDKPAVAARMDPEEYLPYPVCAYHARGNMVPLSVLLADREPTDSETGANRGMR